MSGSIFIETITSNDPELRNRSIERLTAGLDMKALIEAACDLDQFRSRSTNLYHTVRALFFLFTIYRFNLPRQAGCRTVDRTPYSAVTHLRERRFEEAIQRLLLHQTQAGPSAPIASGLAASYHGLAFQKLADQVRLSVRATRGNQWMFRVGHPFDHPLRLVDELKAMDPDLGTFPILREQTPVRMDLCHSAWSDIFFLGMDFPEGARVINTSIDLGVMDRDDHPRPPVEAYLRVIDEPVLRLTSVDLNTSTTITELSEVFDYARDYLGLLKAAVIASGMIPPGVEGSGAELSSVLERVIGRSLGLELVSNVNDIPKGSRLAVSTNLLGALIAVCMRATGQTKRLFGPLSEGERRTVAARAILGEWLGGSGGGWQDSGGVWPGIKLIKGVVAENGDPEMGISRGCLLPRHEVLGEDRISTQTRRALQSSLVLVHGGMAQNVGPILEMVTEKYLSRSDQEWKARLEANGILENVVTALQQGDIQQVARETTRNFFGPIQTIIPWASNQYTEQVISRTRAKFGDEFHGFCMLGGMAGGGMAFFFSPQRQAEGQRFLHQTMRALKKELEHGLPFAMEPLVYQFQINDQGSVSSILKGHDALMPKKYYELLIPSSIRQENRHLTPAGKAELHAFAHACRENPEFDRALESLFERLLPDRQMNPQADRALYQHLRANGFDDVQHKIIRTDLRMGRIGLAQNRLPSRTKIEDVAIDDLSDWEQLQSNADLVSIGTQAIQSGEVAVVTLTAGVGSRWTNGAGTVKAVNPFCRFAGKHRTFLAAHLAKTRKTSRAFNTLVPHVFTTSYLTHPPIQAALERTENYGYEGPVHLSTGRSIGLRLIPMARDLRFAWEELSQQRLDEQQEKVRESSRAALLQWAQDHREASDYTDNLISQCMHPIGHWYEFANLLRNGTLERLFEEHPNLNYLFIHNIDTLGANLDPALLGFHIQAAAALTFEVIPRWFDDQGGGLARVDGRLRLLEGLAIPHEADEFKLSYYNSNSNWLNLKHLLNLFELDQGDLKHKDKVTQAIRRIANRIPSYVTLKDVKKRWGHAQEDVFPVAQFEKIWGDMTAMHELACRYAAVPRQRGQQLKDPAQLDAWLRDGTAAYVDQLCDWSEGKETSL